jgi:hypothetical protein
MTRAEWRIVATVCEALLDVDVARSCGLVRGVPSIDVEHCRWTLRRARAQGIVTKATDVDVVTQQILVACGGSL